MVTNSTKHGGPVGTIQCCGTQECFCLLFYGKPHHAEAVDTHQHFLAKSINAKLYWWQHLNLPQIYACIAFVAHTHVNWNNAIIYAKFTKTLSTFDK